ncbi:zinc ribbon domain-containing protein [Candidatus Woesearchaeota archaeon]|nr:zinc ribbon domain-containing protein [Candidatus Woesearchaeota archaeon]
MAKIHWIVYVIVGLFVSIASYELDYEKLVFFFYAGFVFVFIGILKLIFSIIKGKTSKKENVHHKALHHQQSNIKYCHQCGARLDLHHKFCPKCGARV